MEWFDILGYGMDLGQIALWIASVVLMAAGSAGGAWIAVKRWLLPKEIVQIRDELGTMRDDMDAMRADLKAIQKDLSARKEHEGGYEVLNWWGETGRAPSRMSQAFQAFTREYTGTRKRFPRTILIRKTGEVRELPYPPVANKIPESTSTR